MALSEIYFAVYPQGKNIPSADEWYTDLKAAREDAVTDAENSNDTMIITQINTRDLFSTKAEITLEAI